MPYINIDVDIDLDDLDEFDTFDLIEELNDRLKREAPGRRGFGDAHREALVKMLKELKYGEIMPASVRAAPTLLDQMKVEILIEAKEKYSLDQLKSLLQL